jgi:branched-chain amino acid transport system ATP-binding protein
VTAVLALENIHAGYGGAEILHGVSLHVEPGELVVVIGPNGAGKSTAMKAVFGLLTITSGEIRLRERAITNMPPERVVREGICYVPQTANVFVNLSVEENLEMGAYIRSDDIRPRLEEIYAMFPDLADKRRQAAGDLSGGQRQMVAMGKALMLEPDILMLDEPTAGLSPKFRGGVFETVQRINAAGVPILMVEQNAKQALGIADRGYVLVDGQNRHQGAGRELLADDEVARMFLGAAG